MPASHSAVPLLTVAVQLEVSICASSLKYTNILVPVEVAVLLVRRVRDARLSVSTHLSRRSHRLSALATSRNTSAAWFRSAIRT